MSAPLLVDRRRLVRPPGVPRVPRSVRRANGRPGNLLTGPHLDGASPLAGGAAARGVRRLGHARPCRPTATSCSRATRLAASSIPSSLEQLDLAPGAARGGGDRLREGRRLRGRRLPRRRGRVRARRGRDHARRDLGSRRVPARGGRRDDPAAAARASASWRASGRPRCASATASIPSRCPTSSRCAATPRTRSPAREGSARRPRRRCSREHATLESLLEAGRFSAEADALRALPARRDARPDGVPLPPLPDREPDWRAAAAAADGARARPARRAPGGGRIELISHPALAHLHPTRHHHHPEREERLAALLERSAARATAARDAGADRARPRPRLRRGRSPRSTRRSGSTATRWAGPTSWEAARLAAGAAIEAVEADGFALVAPAGPSRDAEPRDGLLPLRQRRGRRPPRAGRARARARRDRRLGRPPRQRDRGDLPGRRLGARSSRCTSGRSIPGTRRARHERRHDAERSARGRLGRRRVSRCVRRARRAGGAGLRPRTRCSSRRGSTRTSRTRSRRWR